MKLIICLLAGVAITLISGYALRSFWSFSAQKITDYAQETPVVDFKTALNGDFTAEGVLYDYTGRVNIRFAAKMKGDFSNSDGTLDEEFKYSDGHTDVRKWTIKIEDGNNFSATAPDVIGTAKGKQMGNAIVMRYKLKLSERAGGHVLDVTDWMYMLESGRIINRSEMRKFGIKVAELFAVFHRD